MPGGTFQIGDSLAPVAVGVTAELVIAAADINVQTDPQQWGRGLLSTGGRVIMRGASTGANFVRLLAAPHAGDTTITLDTNQISWPVRGIIHIPDSKYRSATDNTPYQYMGEERSISSISLNGQNKIVITLDRALTFDHPKSIDDPTYSFLPHVAFLSRNVLVRSEDPTSKRGHVLFTANAEADIQFAQFKDLGRTTTQSLDNTVYDTNENVIHVGTNQMGRYPVHFHRYNGALGGDFSIDNPSGQFIGNAIVNTVNDAGPDHYFKGGLVIHGTAFVRATNNIVLNAGGAGIVFEDGTEHGNTIEHNFVSWTRRSAGPRVDVRTDTTAQPWTEGSGFWSTAADNIVRYNVIAHPLYVGFMMWRGNAIPEGQFADNEVYSGKSGFESWNHNGGNDVFPGDPNGPRSYVLNQVVWNTTEGFTSLEYPTFNFTIQGAVVVGGMYCHHSGDYGHFGLQILNMYCANTVYAGIGGLINLPGSWTTPVIIANSVFRNVPCSVSIPSGFGSGRHMFDDPRGIVFDNNRLIPGVGKTQYTVCTDFRWATGDVTIPLRFEVHNHNQNPGENFQVLFSAQHPDAILPQTDANVVGAPRAGMTNREAWSEFGIAALGMVAPNDAEASDQFADALLIRLPSGPPLNPNTITQVPQLDQNIVSYTRQVNPSTGAVTYDANFRFVTNKPTNNVWVELRQSGQRFTEPGNSLTMVHYVTVTGLQPGQAYGYRQQFSNSGGTTTIGDNGNYYIYPPGS